MKRKLPAVMVIALAVVAGGCTSQGESGSSIEVTLSGTICVEKGSDCYALHIPDASISVVGPDGKELASGKTDNNGEVTLKTSGVSGPVQIKATSKILKDGKAEGEARLGDKAVSVSIRGDLVAAS